MDSGGKPERNDISGDDSMTINDVHHDPLNENLEETWSALGEQDVRSTSDSDPGMLPPPIPVLPTSLGSIIGQTIDHEGTSELSVLQAPNRTITAANINQEDSEDIAESMAGRRKLKETEDIQNPKITQPGIFGRKATVVEEVVADPTIMQKRKPSRSSENDALTPKSISLKGTGPSIQNEEELQLDMFFQTMYNTTKKLSLIRQIELRREIRQLVMNAEKQEQVANRQKVPQEATETTKKSRLIPSKREARTRSYVTEVSNESSSAISISASRAKSEPQFCEDRRTRGCSQLHLALEFTPSSHILVGVVTASPEYDKASYRQEDVKSKGTLSSKSSPSLYHTCSNASKQSSGIGNGSLFCRICHEGGSNEHFISPCCCRGSLSRVHKTCLERWLAESDSSHCELCGYKYRTKRVPKYGVMSSIFAWLTSNSTSRERRHLLIDILALLIISPIIGLSTILALQLADSLFILDSLDKMEQTEIRVLPRRGIEPDLSNKPHHTLEVMGTMVSRLGQMGIISMVITMDMAYISWVAMRLQSHVTKWYTWYRRNCKVTLIGYPDQVVVDAPLQRSSSISVHQISF